MKTSYNFSTVLRPYGDSETVGRVYIDTAARYGFWEWSDGTEGGGLWFDDDGASRLALIDYDGSFELPRLVIKALRDAGFILDEIYDA